MEDLNHSSILHTQNRSCFALLFLVFASSFCLNFYSLPWLKFYDGRRAVVLGQVEELLLALISVAQRGHTPASGGAETPKRIVISFQLLVYCFARTRCWFLWILDRRRHCNWPKIFRLNSFTFLEVFLKKSYTAHGSINVPYAKTASWGKRIWSLPHT